MIGAYECASHHQWLVKIAVDTNHEISVDCEAENVLIFEFIDYC